MSASITRSQHPALSLSEWPTGDRDAWVAALRRPDFLEDGGRGASWRPASQHSTQGAYARLLAWLLAQGVDLSADEPSARITPDRVRAYVVFLREGRSSVTVASYLGVLCMAVLAMFPNRDWRWLQAFQAQAHRRASPTRQKRDRLVPAGQLHQLGLDLIQSAGDVLDRAREPGAGLRKITAAARDYRDGLIIAFLASRPLRVKNLLQIEIGIHLRQSGGRTTLHFRSSETKERRVRDTIWPDVLEPALARYITQIRPMLIAARAPGHVALSPRPPGAILWVAQGGTPLTPGGLQEALARHTQRRFGHAINAHLFRDCAATTLANEDPNHMHDAATLLGHTTLRTTERSYIAADSDPALHVHYDLIASMRSQARQQQNRAQRKKPA